MYIIRTELVRPRDGPGKGRTIVLHKEPAFNRKVKKDKRTINECILNPMYNKDKISEGGRPRNPEPIGSILGCSGSPRASTMPSGAQTPACFLSAAAHGLTGGAAAEQLPAGPFAWVCGSDTTYDEEVRGAWN